MIPDYSRDSLTWHICFTNICWTKEGAGLTNRALCTLGTHSSWLDSKGGLKSLNYTCILVWGRIMGGSKAKVCWHL